MMMYLFIQYVEDFLVLINLDCLSDVYRNLITSTPYKNVIDSAVQQLWRGNHETHIDLRYIESLKVYYCAVCIECYQLSNGVYVPFQVNGTPVLIQKM